MEEKDTEIKMDIDGGVHMVPKGYISKNSVFIKVFWACAFLGTGYVWYGAYKEIKNQVKDVYKHPNVIVKKTPDTLILRDINDNKERTYLHKLSAKDYFDLNEKDTVYFHDAQNYDKDFVFRTGTQTALKVKQR